MSVNIQELIKKFEKPGEREQADLGRLFHLRRKLSFYLTIPFVFLPLSANTITILANAIQLTGIACIGFGYGNQRLIGLALYYFGDMLDFVDGNIARYRQQSSVYGVYLDQIGHVLVAPCFFAALGLAALRDSGNLLFMYCMILLALFPPLMSYQLLASKFLMRQQSPQSATSQPSKAGGILWMLRKTVSSVFHFKAELVLIALFFHMLGHLVLLYTLYFPARVLLQAFLDRRLLAADERSLESV